MYLVSFQLLCAKIFEEEEPPFASSGLDVDIYAQFVLRLLPQYTFCFVRKWLLKPLLTCLKAVKEGSTSGM